MLLLGSRVYLRPLHVDQRLAVLLQCQTIVEEQEDELMKFLSEEREGDASRQFCHHETGICSHRNNDREEL